MSNWTKSPVELGHTCMELFVKLATVQTYIVSYLQGPFFLFLKLFLAVVNVTQIIHKM